MQAHHGWEEDGLGTGVYLHLLVESLPSEDGRLLRDVTEIRLPLNFKTKKKEKRSIKNEIINVKIQLNLLEILYLSSQSTQHWMAFHIQEEQRVKECSSDPLQTP